MIRGLCLPSGGKPLNCHGGRALEWICKLKGILTAWEMKVEPAFTVSSRKHRPIVPVMPKRRRFKLRCRAKKNLYACQYGMTVSDSIPAVREPVWALSELKSA